MKGNKKHFFLVSQVLSVRHTNQTSKNVADTIFMTFLTILGATEILYSFRLVLGKASKEIPESSRSELFEKFLANNFALSDTEDNTSGPLNIGGIADLPFLETILIICQKFREPGF